MEDSRQGFQNGIDMLMVLPAAPLQSKKTGLLSQLIGTILIIIEGVEQKLFSHQKKGEDPNFGGKNHELILII